MGLTTFTDEEQVMHYFHAMENDKYDVLKLQLMQQVRVSHQH